MVVNPANYLIIYKIKDFFKSFRNKVVVIAALVVVASILLISKYVLKNETSPENDPSGNIIVSNDENKTSGRQTIEQLRQSLSPGIDSVLKNFGIKNEWIKNEVSGSTGDTKSQKKAGKNTQNSAELFVKNIVIPTDLTSIEVNADLTGYFSSLGLGSSVNEDIITKDIVISVNNPDSANKLPLAKLNISHSDKIHRESAIVCVIINNITEYSDEDIDKYLINKTEFSFVFPRNLDEIDLQNKLLHSKKNVIINLTIGGKENYETDFNASMDEKAIHERVKSFSVDFPTVTSVILSKKDSDIDPKLIALISNDLASYKIKVIADTELAQLTTKAEDESKEKYSLFASNLKTKSSLAKSMITSIAVNKDDFGLFYDEILRLKKLGYKFYNFAEYSAKKEAFEKEELLRQEKSKEELLKKQNEKKQTEKKQTDKKTGTKKKPEVKKKTDVKKPTDKKKTEPKKKNDGKKK